jgi:CheY-like chemotaxis protein
VQHKEPYGYRFIPGQLETTQAAWTRFQAADVANACDPSAVHFVPALGGCFLVLQGEQVSDWKQSMQRLLPVPSKPPQALVDDFWEWLQADRPLIAPGLRVMVIDDDRSVLSLLRIVLESAGYTVKAFSDAEIALETLNDEDSPDVMVIDLRMPGMDGRRFVHEIKERELDSKIIIVSAYEAGEAERELKADGSLQKPFAPDDLIALVDNIGRAAD